MLITLFNFFFRLFDVPLYLHSFPTRRSSDLHTPVAGTYTVTATGTGTGTYQLDVALRTQNWRNGTSLSVTDIPITPRSEEHTSELQSQFHLVCRLLLEKKKI